MEYDGVRSEQPLQRLMDSSWLLLAIGVSVPFVSYSICSWLALWMLAPATLP